MTSDILKQPKDPNEDLDYFWDFTAELGEGEAIVSHSVTISGTTATSHSTSVSGGRVTTWVDGGANGDDALITYTISTNNTPPRTIERTQLLRIRER